jgi:hypothetical protein
MEEGISIFGKIMSPADNKLALGLIHGSSSVRTFAAKPKPAANPSGFTRCRRRRVGDLLCPDWGTYL